MTISPEPTPELSGPQQDAQGKWVPGLTGVPGKPTDINPTVNQYDKDIRWQDEPGENQKAPQPAAPKTAQADWLANKIKDYVNSQDLASAAAPQRPIHVAQNDAEKEQHFQALRSLFGLTPDAPAPEKPVDIQPSATAHPDSPEFKAWLRSSSPEEFQKWMESGAAAQAPPSPTDVAVARARAAIPPPAPAPAAVPSPPPAQSAQAEPTPDEMIAKVRNYTAAMGGKLTPLEQAELFKALAQKYQKPEPENTAGTYIPALHMYFSPGTMMENARTNAKLLSWEAGKENVAAAARALADKAKAAAKAADPWSGVAQSPEQAAESVVKWKKEYDRAQRERAFQEALAASGGK